MVVLVLSSGYKVVGIPVNGVPNSITVLKATILYAWRRGSFRVRVRVFHGSFRVRHGVMGRLGFSS